MIFKNYIKRILISSLDIIILMYINLLYNINTIPDFPRFIHQSMNQPIKIGTGASLRFSPKKLIL